MDQLYTFAESTLHYLNNTQSMSSSSNTDISTLPHNGPYTENDIPLIWARLIKESLDILSGVPEAPPPLHEVNHKITLIDNQHKYRYYLPHCPDRLRSQLSEKLGRYTCAQW